MPDEKRLREAAQGLARLCLQLANFVYQADADFRDAVDEVLALTNPAPVTEPEDA